MKKILKWVGIGFAALLVVTVVGVWAMFGTFAKAANSIEKLEDGLYSMEFTGDYGFDKLLAGGGADSDSGVADYLVSFLSHGFCKNDSKAASSISVRFMPAAFWDCGRSCSCFLQKRSLQDRL